MHPPDKLLYGGCNLLKNKTTTNMEGKPVKRRKYITRMKTHERSTTALVLAAADCSNDLRQPDAAATVNYLESLISTYR
jgi:hypothetical protein